MGRAEQPEAVEEGCLPVPVSLDLLVLQSDDDASCIDDLPSELLVIILGYLGKDIVAARGVCRAWRTLSERLDVWNCLLSDACDGVDQPILPKHLSSWAIVPEECRSSMITKATLLDMVSGPPLLAEAAHWRSSITDRFGPVSALAILTEVEVSTVDKLQFFVKSGPSTVVSWRGALKNQPKHDPEAEERWKRATDWIGKMTTASMDREAPSVTPSVLTLSEPDRTTRTVHALLYLSSLRTHEMCCDLRIPLFMLDQMYITLTHAYVTFESLLAYISVDQLIMCTIFVLAKANKFPCAFRRIVSAYKSMPFAHRNVYNSIKLPDVEEPMDLIALYNHTYLPRVRSFVLSLRRTEEVLPKLLARENVPGVENGGDGGGDDLLAKCGANVSDRTKEFSRVMELPFYIERQVRETAQAAIVMFSLNDRYHLDTILLCCVYAVCKSSRYTKQSEIDSDGHLGIPFQEIVTRYTSQISGAMDERYIDIRTGENGSEQSDVIAFYNNVFLPLLEDFVKNLRLHRVHKEKKTEKNDPNE